jgi:hypothetical protein
MATEYDTRWQAIITAIGGAESGGVATSDKPLISGRSDPYATIHVSDRATALGSAIADAQGNWSLQPSMTLFNGLHELSATQVTAFGLPGRPSHFALTLVSPDAAHSLHDGVASFSEPLESAATPHLDNSASFPANPFRAHSASDTSHAPATSRDLGALIDDPQVYVRHASGQAEGRKGVDIVALLGDHQVLDLASIVDKSTANAQLPGIGGFDLGGHHNALKLSIADVLHFGDRICSSTTASAS